MSQADPLVIERTIDAPPARVWRALTDKQELKEWLPFMADFEPTVGHELHFELGKDPAHQYLHVSKVIEVVDGQKLTYGWRYEGYPGDSEVTFELFAEGERTRLKLTHRILAPFPADNPDFAAEGFREGWTYTADGLKDYVEKVKE
jgi:uncharacterized protein YndB with AHSA1/START domain